MPLLADAGARRGGDQIVRLVLGESSAVDEVLYTVGDAADILAMITPRGAGVAVAEVAVAVLIGEVARQFHGIWIGGGIALVAVEGWAVSVAILVLTIRQNNDTRFYASKI